MLVTGKAASTVAVNNVCNETPPNECLPAKLLTGKAANGVAVCSRADETATFVGKLADQTGIWYTGCITGLPSAGALSGHNSCISVRQQCI